MSEEVKININLSAPKPADSVLTILICAHCKHPHLVETEYREKYVAKAKEYKVALDEIWMCGGCLSVYYKVPTMKTECNHPIPPFTEGHAL